MPPPRSLCRGLPVRVEAEGVEQRSLPAHGTVGLTFLPDEAARRMRDVRDGIRPVVAGRGKAAVDHVDVRTYRVQHVVAAREQLCVRLRRDTVVALELRPPERALVHLVPDDEVADLRKALGDTREVGAVVVAVALAERHAVAGVRGNHDPHPFTRGERGRESVLLRARDRARSVPGKRQAHRRHPQVAERAGRALRFGLQVVVREPDEEAGGRMRSVDGNRRPRQAQQQAEESHAPRIGSTGSRLNPLSTHEREDARAPRRPVARRRNARDRRRRAPCQLRSRRLPAGRRHRPRGSSC